MAVELGDFVADTFTFEDKRRTVYRRGSGPAVIVLAEIPGITPKVLDFARRIADQGCTAVLPHLFGVPGHDPYDGGRVRGALHIVRSIVPACVSREFAVLATGKTSPIANWLRALARHEHRRAGGPGVGVVGMCLTGGIALAMAVEEVVVAPVLSQPSLPFPLGKKRSATTDISAADLAIVKMRCAAQGLSVMGLRFDDDDLVPDERFAFLRTELGDAFIAIELDDDDANPDAMLPAHSVLTEHLIDRPGEPTRDALDQVLDFLASRLGSATPGE